MKNIGECKLCKNTCELKLSHIIPRWAIHLIRDASLNNRFYELFNKQNKIIQDGPKEYLLCDPCEQLIGKHEKYFKETIHLARHGASKALDGKNLIIENLDYKKLKLFFLSLLWKASISSKPEFENVSLDNNEEIIRKMILNESPGENSEFAITGIVPLMYNRNQESWATNFFDSKNELLPTIYSIVIGGIFYSISSAIQNTLFPEELILNESGRWIMPLCDLSEIRCLWESIQGHHNKGDNGE